MLVTEVDGVYRLPDYAFGQIVGHAFRVLLQNIQNGQLAVLEHQMQFLFSSEHFDQTDEIDVLELLQFEIEVYWDRSTKK